MVEGLVAALLISLSGNLEAQLQPQPVAAETQADTVIKIVAESQQLPVIPFDQLPKRATYWEGPSLFGRMLPPMLPCPPDNPNAVFYQMADGKSSWTTARSA